MKTITVELPDYEPSIGDIVVIEGVQYKVMSITTHTFIVRSDKPTYIDSRSNFNLERVADGKRCKARQLPTGYFVIV